MHQGPSPGSHQREGPDKDGRRTRHYAGDASWIRDKLEQEQIDLYHRPGKELIADGLTKILPRELLEQFRRRAAIQSRRC